MPLEHLDHRRCIKVGLLVFFDRRQGHTAYVALAMTEPG